MNGSVRNPAVAGRFYPARSDELQRWIVTFLDAVPYSQVDPTPKAIIVPHAGYIYSGAVAAFAYKQIVLSETHRQIKRVVLVGPCHYVPCRGLALSSADSFATPLGEIPLDQPAQKQVLALPQVVVLDVAHAQEHSLEVQLPFLQTVLDQFTLIPMVVGDASPEEVAEVLAVLWGGPETLVVISSDLSHFHSASTAKKLDSATAEAIQSLAPEKIARDQACGRIPVQALLLLAQKFNLHVQTLDLRNSGDTGGSKDRVVGYGAWSFS